MFKALHGAKDLVKTFNDTVRTGFAPMQFALMLAICYGGYWCYSKINSFVADPPKIDGSAVVKSIKGMMPEIDTKAVVKEIVGKIELPSAGEVMKEVMNKVELPQIGPDYEKIAVAGLKDAPIGDSPKWDAVGEFADAVRDQKWKEEILAGRGQKREYMSQQNIKDHNEIAYWSMETEKHPLGSKERREAGDKLMAAMVRYTHKWIEFKE